MYLVSIYDLKIHFVYRAPSLETEEPTIMRVFLALAAVTVVIASTCAKDEQKFYGVWHFITRTLGLAGVRLGVSAGALTGPSPGPNVMGHLSTKFSVV